MTVLAAYRPAGDSFTGRSVAAIFSPAGLWPPDRTPDDEHRLFLAAGGGADRLLCIGAVLALQIYLGGNRYGAEAIVPQIVVLGITRELGPVIAGLMVAGAWARPLPPKSAP